MNAEPFDSTRAIQAGNAGHFWARCGRVRARRQVLCSTVDRSITGGVAHDAHCTLEPRAGCRGRSPGPGAPECILIRSGRSGGASEHPHVTGQARTAGAARGQEGECFQEHYLACARAAASGGSRELVSHSCRRDRCAPSGPDLHGCRWPGLQERCAWRVPTTAATRSTTRALIGSRESSLGRPHPPRATQRQPCASTP